MTPQELYDATRGYWRLNVKNAEKVDYALAVYEGMVLEVYEIVTWLPALSTFMDRPNRKDSKDMEGRYEFVGKIANDKVREQYVDKSVKDYFPVGDSNPIKYQWRKKED